jgi:hypothetical protein
MTSARLHRFTDAQLADALDETWRRRAELGRAALRICEELIARVLRQHAPSAYTVLLTEDRSHDAPHAHLRTISDRTGQVLADGSSDEWHDLNWARTIDEIVHDMYMFGANEFTHDEFSEPRTYQFTINQLPQP